MRLTPTSAIRALPLSELMTASSSFCTSEIFAEVSFIIGAKCASTCGMPADLAIASVRVMLSSVRPAQVETRLARRSYSSASMPSLALSASCQNATTNITAISDSSDPNPSARRRPILRLFRFIVWLLRGSVTRAAHQAADVEDQRDAAVAHDGGARHVVDRR